MFGRQLGRTEGSRGPPGLGFKPTADNQYDVENKRLCNVADALGKTDAVNLVTVEHLVQDTAHLIIDHFKPITAELNRLRGEIHSTVAESLKPIDAELTLLKKILEDLTLKLQPILMKLDSIKLNVNNNLIVDVQSNTSTLSIIE